MVNPACLYHKYFTSKFAYAESNDCRIKGFIKHTSDNHSSMKFYNLAVIFYGRGTSSKLLINSSKLFINSSKLFINSGFFLSWLSSALLVHYYCQTQTQLSLTKLGLVGCNIALSNNINNNKNKINK